jgi:hypothetical protein
MLLLGLAPETVLEVSQKSISFWRYQVVDDSLNAVSSFDCISLDATGDRLPRARQWSNEREVFSDGTALQAAADSCPDGALQYPIPQI